MILLGLVSLLLQRLTTIIFNYSIVGTALGIALRLVGLVLLVLGIISFIGTLEKKKILLVVALLVLTAAVSIILLSTRYCFLEPSYNRGVFGQRQLVPAQQGNTTTCCPFGAMCE